MNKLTLAIIAIACCIVHHNLLGLTQKQVQAAYEQLLKLREKNKKPSKAEQAYQQLLERKEELKRLAEEQEKKEQESDNEQPTETPKQPEEKSEAVTKEEPAQKETEANHYKPQGFHQTRPKPRPQLAKPVQQETVPAITPQATTPAVLTAETTKPKEQTAPAPKPTPTPKPIQPANHSHGPHEIAVPATIEPQQVDREVSLSIFSALIPIFAANPIDKIIDINIEDGNLPDHKDAAQNIQKFLDKLEAKLKTIKKASQIALMHSSQFKQLSWVREFFKDIALIQTFCNQRLNTYNTMTDKPDSVVFLQKKFLELTSRIKKLCKKYFAYQIAR